MPSSLKDIPQQEVLYIDIIQTIFCYGDKECIQIHTYYCTIYNNPIIGIIKKK